MKIYGALFISAILLSFSAAYFTLSLQKNNFANKNEIKEINLLISQIDQQLKPELILDLNNIYPSQFYFQLLQSSSLIKKDNLSYTKSCDQKINYISSSSSKDDVIENFRCKRIKELPANFFTQSPSINNEGISYAYLAYLTGREPFINNNWIKANLNFFHVDELTLLPLNILEKPFEQLATLNKDVLDGILSNQNYVLGDRYFLKRSMTNKYAYLFYNRSEFEKYIKEHNYFIKNYNLNEECFYHHTNLCFEPSSKNIFKQFRFSSTIILIISFGILILVSFALYIRIKQKEQEDEQKKHALRVLTHELRTPITNLILQIEQLNKNSSNLPLESQEIILKIESEIYRLKRLAEKSTSYLQSHEKNKLFKLNLQLIDDLENFIEHILDYHRESNVLFTYRAPQSAILVDPYWLTIAIKNLIENAHIHGAKPIQLIVEKVGANIHIKVIDQGVCEFSSLIDLNNLDRRTFHNNQQGLGLGLSIVKKIIQEMNGQFLYSNKPTTFQIIFPDKK